MTNVVVIASGIAALCLMGVFFASGMPFGAGYQPVPRDAVRRMTELSRPEGRVVYDLGSGFGRVLFEAAARDPSRCVGIEIDPVKCWWTKREAKKRRLDDKVQVVNSNLLDVDLSTADIAFVFLSPRIMRHVKRKVLKEMKAGSVVVSYDHRFEGWAPETEDPGLKVLLYRIPSRFIAPSTL